METMQNNFIVLVIFRGMGAIFLVSSILIILNSNRPDVAAQVFTFLSMIVVLSAVLRMGTDNLIIKLYANPKECETANHFKNVLMLNSLVLGLVWLLILIQLFEIVLLQLPFKDELVFYAVFGAIGHSVLFILAYSMLGKGQKYYAFTLVYLFDPVLVIVATIFSEAVDEFVAFYVVTYISVSAPFVLASVRRTKIEHVVSFIRKLKLAGQYFVMGVGGIAIANLPIFFSGLLHSAELSANLQSSLRLSGILGFILPLVIARDLTGYVQHFQKGEIGKWWALYKNSIFITNSMGIAVLLMFTIGILILRYVNLNLLPNLYILFLCLGVQYVSILLGPIAAGLISLDKEKYLLFFTAIGLPLYLIFVIIFGGYGVVPFLIPLFVFYILTNALGFGIIYYSCKRLI